MKLLLHGCISEQSINIAALGVEGPFVLCWQHTVGSSGTGSRSVRKLFNGRNPVILFCPTGLLFCFVFFIKNVVHVERLLEIKLVHVHS